MQFISAQQPKRGFVSTDQGFTFLFTILGIGVAMAAVNTFAVTPWIIYQVKPDWKYGTRVLVGIGATAAVAAAAALTRGEVRVTE